MAATTKIGVDASGFRTGVEQAKAALKSLDASLKVNEASFKAGGNAEIYMQQKMQLLNDKMQKQSDLVKQLQAGLDKMRASGVNPLSVEYQRLETQMLNAQTAMLETKTSMDALDGSEINAIKSTSTLNDGLNSIGKKMSLDQVISGINRITSAMENAGKKAIEFGRNVWNQITETATQADDLATMAVTYGMDPDLLQRQLKVLDTVADTSIEAYQKARMKINRAVNNPTKEQAGYLADLGLVTGGKSDDSVAVLVKNAEDALWEVGERLRSKVQTGELTPDDADLMAQALFGRSFQELNPLFSMGQDAFQAAVESQTSATTQALEQAAQLNDSIELQKRNLETLKIEILGGIAPGLRDMTDSASKFLNRLTEYAQSEDGKGVLSSISDGLSDLFKNIENADPEKVLNKVSSTLNTIKDGFVWVVENREDIFQALKYIAGGFALLKVSETVLSFVKVAQGLGGLIGGGSAAPAATSGSGSAGGGLLGGARAWISDKLGKASKLIPGTMTAWNAVPIVDWFTNNTLPGQLIRNTGDIGGSISTTLATIKENFQKNVQSFVSDWAGVANGIFTDPNKQASNNKLFDPQQLQTEIDQLFNKPVAIPAEPEIADDAAEQIAAHIGTVQIGVRLVPVSLYGGPGGSGLGVTAMFHANGIPFVPRDNYLAFLHRGERVMPASVNRSYTANSNLYVENMTMNNGMDAQALVDAMRAENRRISTGFGG